MNVAVCVPFRPRAPHENDLWAFCRRRWDALGWPVYTGAVEREGRFNRSASRNDAARQAIADGATILVMANSDTTYLRASDMVAAVNHARLGGWSLPDQYIENDRRSTAAILNGAPVDLGTLAPERSWTEWPGRSGLAPPAGPQVVPVDWFLDVGGWDEEFLGHAYEDGAFREALDTLCGHHKRFGMSIHLFHDRTREDTIRSAGARANRHRYHSLYRRFAGQPVEMRRVVESVRAMALPEE